MDGLIAGVGAAVTREQVPYRHGPNKSSIQDSGPGGPGRFAQASACAVEVDLVVVCWA